MIAPKLFLVDLCASTHKARSAWSRSRIHSKARVGGIYAALAWTRPWYTRTTSSGTSTYAVLSVPNSSLWSGAAGSVLHPARAYASMSVKSMGAARGAAGMPRLADP